MYPQTYQMENNKHLQHTGQVKMDLKKKSKPYKSAKEAIKRLRERNLGGVYSEMIKIIEKEKIYKKFKKKLEVNRKFYGLTEDQVFNISWSNIQGLIGGWIYGLFTFAFFSKKRWYLFKFDKRTFWLPPVYAKGYNTAIWEEVTNN